MKLAITPRANETQSGMLLRAQRKAVIGDTVEVQSGAIWQRTDARKCGDTWQELERAPGAIARD